MSPKIARAVVTSGMYTGALKGPLLENPTIRRIVWVVKMTFADASNSKV